MKAVNWELERAGGGCLLKEFSQTALFFSDDLEIKAVFNVEGMRQGQGPG